ncbi:MAG: hypothetical protein CMP61_05955 [Flavobacteriales bacterium]|nr:hypothetical protein [Flavobacteriales bacterium]|tara:strand:- start:17831 stop:19132 length:1302 start_codon:yes stop_codon:yes gene_type:complete
MAKKLLILGLLIIKGLSAQELQLQEAVRIALANNHGVIVAKQESEYTKTGIHSGAVGLLPTVDANAGGNYTYSITDQAFHLASIPSIVNQEAAQSNQSAKISARYILFNGGERLKAYEQLKMTGDVSDIQTKITIESTLIQLVNRYYEVARLSNQLNLIQESLTLSKARLNRLNTNYEYGNIGKIEVFNAQVDFNNDSANYVSTQLNLRTAKNELNFLLGRKISIDFSVALELDLPKLEDVEVYIEKAKANNTSILLSNIQLTKLELDKEIVSSRFMPTIVANMDYGYAGSASDVGVFKSSSSLGYTGGVSLSWNLFDGMKKRKAIEQAKINIQVNTTKQQQTLLNIEKEAQNYHDAIQQHLQLIQLEKQNIAVAKLNLDKSKALYENGTLTSIQFRQAQLNLLQIQNKLNNFKYVCKVYEYQLLRMTNELVQ